MKSEKFEKLSRFFSDKTKGKINESNLKYVLVGFAVVVVLIVVIIVLAVKGSGNSSANISETGQTEESAVLTVETEESVLVEASEAVLEENAYPLINDMMSIYFKAIADGDIDTVKSIEIPLSDMKELTIVARSEYIEDFENLLVYTKTGPTENSFITFAYNEIRFYGIETTAAAIYTFYVKQNEEGNYYIYNGEINETEEEYISTIIAQEDVVDLFTKVNVKFQEAIDSDPELARMLAELPDQLNESIGTAVAELNTAEETEAVSADPVNEEADTETEAKEVEFETVRATSAVNVRSAASEDASKLGKLAKDETVKRIESLDSGWSCIEYNGGQGFVKSEYLTVSSVTYKDGTVENLSGTCTPTTTINVRASASENADKIGIANAGEKLKLLEILENGWTKIEYEGKEAYVKSEYLTY